MGEGRCPAYRVGAMRGPQRTGPYLAGRTHTQGVARHRLDWMPCSGLYDLDSELVREGTSGLNRSRQPL